MISSSKSLIEGPDQVDSGSRFRELVQGSGSMGFNQIRKEPIKDQMFSKGFNAKDQRIRVLKDQQGF